jgi:hypothetical protein
MEGYASLVAGRLEGIRERILEAAARSGRDAQEVEILAVTKFHPIAAVEAAWNGGIRRFGENRVQEALAKYPAFFEGHPDLHLDLLGHLQANKARKALGLFTRIDSIDSLALLEELIGLASDPAKIPLGTREVLLELRTAEDSKTGFTTMGELEGACRLFAEGIGLPFSLRGLMTLAPNVPDPTAIRGSFRSLRKARERLAAEFGLPGFDVLSMGMSGDFEIAVEEGANLVRIGTALFGERQG